MCVVETIFLHDLFHYAGDSPDTLELDLKLKGAGKSDERERGRTAGTDSASFIKTSTRSRSMPGMSNEEYDQQTINISCSADMPHLA